MPRNLGLDIGDRKIGVALSDPSCTLATPLKTIIRLDDDSAITEIVGLATKYNVDKIIVGLPYSLNGTIGKQAEKVLLFKDKLLQRSSIAILMQDERLSSVSANQKLREAGKKKDKLKKEMDAAAASVILQDYLDTLKLSS
ncbi:MAG: Holliday junction resolvase RuvX [Dehalococcoidia bacterium]|nr:Holliday junction resolvase RuvX [Dehalococcoidia bacterium]MDD5493075.1 Holliday junction resolvase RuvX [Dehalococcoidia bacterium]